nr:uncharacterized protein LOC127339908 [Lolium perenne]
MELLVLLAVVLLLGFFVSIRRRSYSANRRAPASAAPPAVHRVRDPDVAHRALVEDADGFSSRPVMPFFVNLAKMRGGRRNENISTVPHGPHWRALRCAGGAALERGGEGGGGGGPDLGRVAEGGAAGCTASERDAAAREEGGGGGVGRGGGGVGAAASG